MARATASITDSFTGSIGGSWSQTNTGWGTITHVAATDNVRGSATNSTPANRPSMRHSTALAAGQWASIVLGGFSFQSATYAMGVTVRGSGSANTLTHYAAVVLSDAAGPNYTTKLYKVVNNGWTELHSASSSWANGDRMDIEVEGDGTSTEVRLCKNGTPLGGSFTYTDTTSPITSGGAGVYGSSANDARCLMDDFEAGEFGSTQSQAPRSMHILNLMRK